MKRPCAIIFPLVLLCLWIAGCTPASTREALARADSIMAAAPDSALTILDALDPATLNSPGTRAIYAVSLTEARYKTDIPIQNDSLISVATDYYLTHGSPKEKARAFYFSAIVKYLDSNYEQAIVDGLRAEKHALSASDHLRLGLTYRTIADCFDRLYDWSSALHYYRLSYGEFCKAPDNVYTDWALLDIARGEMALDNYDEAAGLLALTDSIAKVQGNTPMAVTSLSIRAKCDFNRRDFKGAIRALEGIRQLDKDMLTADHYRTLGVSYATLGDIASAKACRDSLSRLQPGEQSVDYAINRVVGNYDVANSQLEHIVDSTNVELYKILKRNYAEVISEFYGRETAAGERLLRKERTVKYLMAALCLVTLLLGTIVYVYRMRLMRKDIEQKMLVASNLRSMLAERENSIELLNEKVTSLSESSEKMRSSMSDLSASIAEEQQKAHKEARKRVREALATKVDAIEQLCEAYDLHHNKPNKQAKIYAQVCSMIEGIRSDRKTIARLEKIADTHLDNLMKRFRADFPDLHDWEYTLFLYIVLGFSAGVIGILQNVKTDVIYTRKASLKQKIKASSSRYTEEYILILT